MNIEEKFNEFYNKFLIENKNNFDEIENLRQDSIKERKQNKILITISIILAIFLSLTINIFSKTKNNRDLESLAVFCFNLTWVLPAFIAIFRRKKLLEYDKIYKEKIITNLVNSFCSTIQYSPNEGLSSEDFKKIELEQFSHFYSSNLIKGLYMNEEINIATVVSNYNYYNSSNSRSQSLETFSGLFTKFRLQKNSNLKLYLLKNKENIEKKLFTILLGDVKQILNNKKNKDFLKNNYAQININELNPIFYICSTDPELTKNILDSDMNKILIDIFNKVNFEILIEDYYIYMKFYIEGLFSIPTPEKETFDKKIIFKNFEILYIIFYLVSKLKEKIDF